MYIPFNTVPGQRALGLGNCLCTCLMFWLLMQLLISYDQSSWIQLYFQLWLLIQVELTDLPRPGSLPLTCSVFTTFRWESEEKGLWKESGLLSPPNPLQSFKNGVQITALLLETPSGLLVAQFNFSSYLICFSRWFQYVSCFPDWSLSLFCSFKKINPTFIKHPLYFRCHARPWDREINKIAMIFPSLSLRSVYLGT